MKKIIDRIVNSEIMKIWVAYFLLIWMCFNQFMHFRVTSDLAGMYGRNNIYSLRVDFKNLLVQARLTAPLFNFLGFVFEKIGVTPVKNVWFLIVFGIAVYAISATIIYSTIARISNINRVILFIAILICFVNPLIVETYLYLAYVFAGGVLFAVLSSRCAYSDKKILCFLFAFLSACTYQINVIIALLLTGTMIFIRDYGKKPIDIIKSEVVACIVCGCGGLAQVVINKIGIYYYGSIGDDKNPTLRVAGSFFKDMFVLIRRYYRRMEWFMPEFTPFILIAVLFILVTLILLKDKSYIRFIIYCIYTGIALLLPFSFKIITNQQTFARVMFPIFFALGCYTIASMHILTIKETRWILIVTNLVILFFAIVTFYQTQTYVTDSYIEYALDQNLARQIQSRIDDYEKETGIKVTTIASTEVQSDVFAWDEQFSKSHYTYNHKVYQDPWARACFINLCNKTNYKNLLLDEKEAEEIFKGVSMEKLDLDSQLIFDGETLYWAVY